MTPKTPESSGVMAGPCMRAAKCGAPLPRTGVYGFSMLTKASQTPRLFSLDSITVAPCTSFLLACTCDRA